MSNSDLNPLYKHVMTKPRSLMGKQNKRKMSPQFNDVNLINQLVKPRAHEILTNKIGEIGFAPRLTVSNLDLLF